MTKPMAHDPAKPANSSANASAHPSRAKAPAGDAAARGPGPNRRPGKDGASRRVGAAPAGGEAVGPRTAAAAAATSARAGRAETRRSEPEPSEPTFEPGARVRVTSGPFEGKTGVVQALVGRRSARVLFGPLPVQIDVDDLAPSEPAAGGRGRLRLTSSHRKPVPARS